VIDDAGFEASAIVRGFESELEDWNPEEFPSAARGAEDPELQESERDSPSPGGS
jgi:hypothetical protein